MLFEKYIICEDGFGNLYDEKGECTGFQLKVRLPYYRGVRLSLIDDLRITVAVSYTHLDVYKRQLCRQHAHFGLQRGPQSRIVLIQCIFPIEVFQP